MKVVVIGGGIAGAYIANRLKEKDKNIEVLILSKEKYLPYDRIHLCGLIDKSLDVDKISLDLNSKVDIKLNQEVIKIDKKNKIVYSKENQYSYDYLVIATGSKPKELFDISHIKNSATFRSADDSFKIANGIKGKNVVIFGVGPIGLELVDTLTKIKDIKHIYLISRGEHLYDKNLNYEAIRLIKDIFEKDKLVTISFNDSLVDAKIEDNIIKKLITKNYEIEDLFLIFGVGISPNIDFAKDAIETSKGVLVDDNMKSSDDNIFAIGEAAQVRSNNFIAGRVKECIDEANVAVENILGKKSLFKKEVSIDGLKVGSFLFADVASPYYNPKDEANENIVILSKKDNRIDQYIVNNDKLVRFIGVNTNIDLIYLKTIIENDNIIEPNYFYSNRLIGERGKLICSCSSAYELDLVDIIKENVVTNFAELKEFSEAGRVCGRCKQDVIKLIEKTPVDPKIAQKIKEEKERLKKEAKLNKIKKRIEKFNKLHPKNQLDATNLEEAIKAFELNKDFNRWVSMITANLRLQPEYEEVVKQGVMQLNKIPIIWLELASCTGNSEAFIKTTHPKIDDLILNYISLDYSELLMASAGDKSEEVLNEIIKKDKGQYVLIVEGAIPTGLDGKYLRIGPKGESGLSLLKRVANNAAAIFAVGSCALDGGVVASYPNPTNAVGVSDILDKDNIINLPGCPVNPINVVGTLLHYIMFDELPQLDEKRRPKWAYSQRVHDNCERRGHYDLDEFVLEWGDEGAKKGWCLFKMGCKGPYSFINCPLVKFNEGTSWPVQSGHGCFACGEGKIAFDKYANNRVIK